ncbi:hypothetical protein ABZ863_05720 [Saccharomonospora sp. NPDC046836]|uniref:hypothetical protein n=1 Tax=Saccharomonospora sp. NPDC046836 TaxID=3156921 RepID=UPI0033C3333F
MNKLVRGWLAAVLLLLAGCASPVAGMAAPDPEVLREIERERQRNEPLSAQDALGDFTTVDYCSLLDVEALAPPMRIDGDPLPSFEYCDLPVTMDGSTVTVSVGMLRERETGTGQVVDPDKELPRQLTMERMPGAGECYLYIVFPDDYQLQVHATTYAAGAEPGDIPEEQLCLLSETVLDLVVESLAEEKPVRHFSFADNSFGSVDACGDGAPMLDGGQLAAVLGEGEAQQIPVPSGHYCRWELGEAYASVAMYVGVPPQEGAGTVRESIAGREAFVYESGGEMCVIELPHQPFAGASNGEVEFAGIFVRGVTRKPPCEAARAMAGAVWPKLPAS